MLLVSWFDGGGGGGGGGPQGTGRDWEGPGGTGREWAGHRFQEMSGAAFSVRSGSAQCSHRSTIMKPSVSQLAEANGGRAGGGNHFQ